jgi:hypothetical protein
VSRARGSELACLISVTTSCRRAHKRGLGSKLPDVNIREQQTISQLIISDQLSFDYSDSSTKNKGYLVLKLVTVVFGA